MPSQSLRQLITVLMGCIRGGNHTRALRLLVTNLPLTGGHYLLRRSVAEILQDMGRIREAVEIYEILVRHLTNAGHPLLALVVAQRLSKLEPSVGSHFDHLAKVYGKGSQYLDTSRTLGPLDDPEMSEPLDLSGAAPELPLERLAEMAHELAILKDNFISSPEMVPPIPLLSRLDTRTLRTLVELLSTATFSDEEIIAGEGQPMKAPLLIADGHLRVTLPDKRSALIGAGALVGHRTILGAEASDFPLDAVAVGPIEALTLDKETLPMVQGDPTIQRTVANFDIACLVERAIERSTVFSRIPPEDRWELIEKMEARILSDNTTLIHQGQISDGLYLIVNGRTDINKRDGEWDVTFKTLDIGEVVGEISLVTEGPAVASVVTDGATRVLYLKAESVQELCERFPSVLAELRESAAKRLLSQEA